MLGIMRKDALTFGLFAVPMMGLLCGYHIARGVQDLSDLFLTGVYIILVAWGGIATSESVEAYGFLKTLPLTDGEIVAGKFLLVAGTVAACFAALLGVVWASELDRGDLPLAGLYFVCFAVAALLFSGSAYSATYAWGLSRVRVLGWLAFIALMAASFLFIELVLREGRLDIHEIAFLRGGWPNLTSAAVAAAGIAGYYGLMRLAIRIKERREV